MPQMYPLWWTCISLLASLLIVLIMAMVFFYMKYSITLNPETSHKLLKFNLKW